MYLNNSALYGQNVASYAVKVILEGSVSDKMKINNIGPGIPYDKTLKFIVKDFDNQIMVLDSQNQISITPADPSIAKVKGFNIQPLVNGVASFENLIVHADAGSSGIILDVTSKSIDKRKINDIFGSQISDNTIELNLRFCKPGERILSNICYTCTAGTYSLEWNSTGCEQCMEDAVCAGGSMININPGYWRATQNSTKIIRCLNEDACAGGYADSLENPTNCAKGYEGNI